MCVCVCVCVHYLLSCVQLFETPWTVRFLSGSCPWLCMVACQAPLSMGFLRQEYWSGLPLLCPGDLPDPEIEPGSPALQANSLLCKPPGKPHFILAVCICWGFPGGASGKEAACIAGELRDTGSILGLGRSLEKEMANEVNPKLSTDLYFSPLETINLFLKSVNLSFFWGKHFWWTWTGHSLERNAFQPNREHFPIALHTDTLLSGRCKDWCDCF